MQENLRRERYTSRVRRIATPPCGCAAVLALTAWLAGCGPEPAADLDDALRAYDSGRFADSLRIAGDVQRGSQDQGLRQQAAYVVGCSALELGRSVQARDALAIASRSQDPVVAGRALAKQGELAVAERRWSDAASDYSAAGAKLPGSDGDRARALAREASAKALDANRLPPAPPKAAARTDGTKPEPPRGVDPAKPAEPAPVVVTPVEVKPAPLPATDDNAPWTVSAGVFSTETAARQRATNVAKDAKRAKLPTPKVVRIPSSDARAWVVEVGSFSSKDDAEAARKRISLADSAVVKSRAAPVTPRRR